MNVNYVSTVQGIFHQQARVVKIFRTSFRLLISSTEILKRNSCVLPGRMKTIIFLTNMVKDNLRYEKILENINTCS